MVDFWCFICTRTLQLTEEQENNLEKMYDEDLGIMRKVCYDCAQVLRIRRRRRK